MPTHPKKKAATVADVAKVAGVGFVTAARWGAYGTAPPVGPTARPTPRPTGRLGPKTATGSGGVSWTWKVGSRTTVGSWPVTVTCRAGGSTASARASLIVR